MASREQRSNREKKKPKADKNKKGGMTPAPMSSGGNAQVRSGQLFDKKK